MSEGRVVEGRAPGQEPVTRATLERDLRALGLQEDTIVVVHGSLSQLGWVAGGAQAVVEALLGVLGASGTLVMPTHSSHLSDPSQWQNPPVPESWWKTIRAETPAFDVAMTPTRQMGAIADTFRRHPAALRSGHPQFSFAAMGPNAKQLVADHPIECRLGDRSPLGALYKLDAEVLLLGVDHGNNTSLHLAEYHADYAGKTDGPDGAPMLVDGKREWVVFTDLKTSNGDFARLGEDFATDTDRETRGPAGWGVARLMRIRAVVDYAKGWLESHR